MKDKENKKQNTDIEKIMDDIDEAMGKIHQQYVDNLKENPDEANGYAGAYAIVKELFNNLQARTK